MSDLFDVAPAVAFDGKTYEPERDHERLKGQLSRVYNLMRDGRWRTLDEIASQARGSVPAVSARLRDLRKAKYGSHVVGRESVGRGLFRYKLEVRS